MRKGSPGEIQNPTEMGHQTLYTSEAPLHRALRGMLFNAKQM